MLHWISRDLSKIMATAQNENAIYESFKCSICLEIFENPVTVQCGNNHTFCAECVKQLTRTTDPTCTLCRQRFDPSRVIRNKQVKMLMKKQHLTCTACNQLIPVTKMRNHQATCSKIDRTIRLFQPIKETTQYVPKDLPNRQTFPCPYCDQSNFDNKALVDHCNQHHQHDPIAVVCPICASMPWGDKNQLSSNFIHHLNMRHKFEYDTFVDYQQDDDEMLRLALQASLESC